MKTKNTIYVIAISLIGVLNMSCGARETGVMSSTDSASTTRIDGYAYCNQFVADNVQLSGNVMVYADEQGNDLSDRVRIRISALSDKIDKSGNVKLVFFRWRAPENDVPYIDPTALDVRFEIPASSANATTAVGNYMTAINISSINSVRNTYGLSSGSAEDVMKQVNVVITKLDKSWHAIKAVLYDGATVLGSADFLIPAFEANPDLYQNWHHPTLSNLHPFIDEKGTLNEDFAVRSDDFCFDR